VGGRSIAHLKQVTKAADVTMAQLGSAQREPSMEEILASIRRIIEDSDSGRRPDEIAEPAQSGHGLSAVQSVDEAATQSFLERRGPAEVIEVETFRGGLQDEARDVAPPKPISLAEVQAQLAAEREAREAAEGEMAAPSSAAAFVAAPSPLAAARAASEWRLGVPEPEPEPTPEFQPAEVEFDVDEVANTVLQDITAFQHPDEYPEEVAPPSEPPVAAEPVRLSLISDRTGRQVAAAFNELNEALAARSRRSLEEMAEEMLRPMLQDWLDNNLPTLVERLVREEIERVARGT
jgi:cell pole-organizing protein PopZ